MIYYAPILDSGCVDSTNSFISFLYDNKTKSIMILDIIYIKHNDCVECSRKTSCDEAKFSHDI